ncbi:flagellar basal-body rod protein FlgF [Oceanibacterium hippocampi]|uniref:Flagellar basal-body rod protein FlgF n=1 Tax=Oceanibacterium hippocampi TaxID=745714 RepID=A0A1Y5U507_9PROT|nr:flagellar basal-body rod protein FlgF [Oceanibacterium hippocampi]SLN77131.1 Flagellar basal-body rod protein FlgG [Oceanibacterium hippocampi]
MENAVYIGLSKQMAMRRELDIIANNIANMNTTAFKSETVLFEEYLVDTAVGEKASFVQDYGVLRNVGEGALRETGNTLDVALRGNGYMVVQTPGGDRYTRVGQLHVDDAGNLVTGDNHPILDSGGSPIFLDPQGGRPVIATDGSVSNGFGPLGRIDLVTFANEQALKPVGTGLYAAGDQVPEPAEGTEVLQGWLESSNVQGLQEMTRMMDVLRSYQSLQRLLDANNELQTRAVERLARFG